MKYKEKDGDKKNRDEKMSEKATTYKESIYELLGEIRIRMEDAIPQPQSMTQTHQEPPKVNDTNTDTNSSILRKTTAVLHKGLLVPLGLISSKELRCPPTLAKQSRRNMSLMFS